MGYHAIKWQCFQVDSECIGKTAEFNSEDGSDYQGTTREDVGSFLQVCSISRVPPALVYAIKQCLSSILTTPELLLDTQLFSPPTQDKISIDQF